MCAVTLKCICKASGTLYLFDLVLRHQACTTRLLQESKRRMAAQPTPEDLARLAYSGLLCPAKEGPA